VGSGGGIETKVSFPGGGRSDAGKSASSTKLKKKLLGRGKDSGILTCLTGGFRAAKQRGGIEK